LTWHLGLALLSSTAAGSLLSSTAAGRSDKENLGSNLRRHQDHGPRPAALLSARRHGANASPQLPTLWLEDEEEVDLEESAPAPPRNVSGVFGRISSLKVKRRGRDVHFRRKNSNQQRQVLLNQGDVQYVTHLSIGHQVLAGIIDTGSPSLVVFARKCTSCGRAARYDPPLSPDHLEGRLTTKHVYGSGVAYSEDASDLVSVGPFQPTRQTFWEVQVARMPVLRRAVFEAIIGLGPPEVTALDAWDSVRQAITNISAFLDKGKHSPSGLFDQVQDGAEVALETSNSLNMLDNFKVTTFSICLGARPGADGYLVWNDPSPFDNPAIFARIPVFGNRTWSVRMQNMRLVWPHTDSATQPTSVPLQLGSATPREDDLGCGAGCSVLIDSGTSLLTLPGSAITSLEQALEGMKIDHCSNLERLPELAFELGDAHFSLPPDAYISQVMGTVPSYLEGVVRFRRMMVGQGSSLVNCQLLLLESAADAQNGPLWILGVPFFRKYYTSFHLGERRSERALFVASASEDCNPVSRESASLARATPYKRHIDPTKVHIPQSVEKASTSSYVNL